MQLLTIYGIPNCDSTKKAITWLKGNKLDFHFHDYKKEGITISKLNEWAKQESWELLLNKRGTTWKKLAPETQAIVNNKKAALVLMQQQTSLIKRPVIEINGKILIGFDENIYRSQLLIT